MPYLVTDGILIDSALIQASCEIVEVIDTFTVIGDDLIDTTLIDGTLTDGFDRWCFDIGKL